MKILKKFFQGTVNMLAKKQNFIDISQKKNGAFINYLIPFLILILQFMTFIYLKNLRMQIPLKLVT